MPLRETPRGLSLHIRATPKSGRDEVVGFVSNANGQRALAVKVTAAPEKGAANAAVISTLAKTMRVAKSSFELISGETARDKILRIVANAAAVQLWITELSKAKK